MCPAAVERTTAKAAMHRDRLNERRLLPPHTALSHIERCQQSPHRVPTCCPASFAHLPFVLPAKPAIAVRALPWQRIAALKPNPTGTPAGPASCGPLPPWPSFLGSCEGRLAIHGFVL